MQIPWSVDGIEGRGPLLSRVTHGRPIPLHAGPGSRALLAFRSDEEIKDYLKAEMPLVAVTATTIVAPEALWREVRLIRERGYALGYRDNLSGVTGVAFPVFDADSRIQGAVSVGGPEDQFDDVKLASFIPRDWTNCRSNQSAQQIAPFRRPAHYGILDQDIAWLRTASPRPRQSSYLR